MATRSEENLPKEGTVKFFGGSYGFFTDKDGVDAHVNSATLEKFGFTPRDATRDAEVVFEAKEHDEGLKVTKIISIGKKFALEPRSSKYQAPEVKIPFADEHIGLTIIAKVRYYLPKKQYGFLKVVTPKGYADIFFHLSGVSDSSVMAELQNKTMQKGRLVTAVVASSQEYGVGVPKPPIALVTGFCVPLEKGEEPKVNSSKPKPLAEISFMACSAAE